MLKPKKTNRKPDQETETPSGICALEPGQDIAGIWPRTRTVVPIPKLPAIFDILLSLVEMTLGYGVGRMLMIPKDGIGREGVGIWIGTEGRAKFSEEGERMTVSQRRLCGCLTWGYLFVNSFIKTICGEYRR